MNERRGAVEHPSVGFKPQEPKGFRSVIQISSISTEYSVLWEERKQQKMSRCRCSRKLPPSVPVRSRYPDSILLTGSFMTVLDSSFWLCDTRALSIYYWALCNQSLEVRWPMSNTRPPTHSPARVFYLCTYVWVWLFFLSLLFFPSWNPQFKILFQINH